MPRQSRWQTSPGNQKDEALCPRLSPGHGLVHKESVYGLFNRLIKRTFQFRDFPRLPQLPQRSQYDRPVCPVLVHPQGTQQALDKMAIPIIIRGKSGKHGPIIVQILLYFFPLAIRKSKEIGKIHTPFGESLIASSAHRSYHYISEYLLLMLRTVPQVSRCDRLGSPKTCGTFRVR